jgi:uncharacterized phage-associated protein
MSQVQNMAKQPLKLKISVPKLGVYCYACIYERLSGAWGVFGFRRGQRMPLRFQPKLDKIVELLLYLAHKRPGADKYQAVKFFYLADREHLTRYGRPITFDNYFALWYGPIASKALDLLEGDQHVLEEAGIQHLPFRTEAGKAKNNSDTIYIREPNREVNLDLFSKSDLRVFDEIVKKYGNSSFDELMNLTHAHNAYKIAWRSRRMGERAEMYYEEMIDDKKRREDLIEDLGPVSDTGPLFTSAGPF